MGCEYGSKCPPYFSLSSNQLYRAIAVPMFAWIIWYTVLEDLFVNVYIKVTWHFHKQSRWLPLVCHTFHCSDWLLVYHIGPETFWSAPVEHFPWKGFKLIRI